MSNSDLPWDHEVDVLVVGSGNGALTAAITAHDKLTADNNKVLVIEKGEFFGGTSALSGGGVWVPNNRYAQAAGAEDSYDDALAYLKSTIPADWVREGLIEQYLKSAPEMVEFLHQNTRVRYTSLAKYPDYYSNNPGSKNGHRSMEPEPVKFTDLGKDQDIMMTGGVMYILYKFAVTQVEAQKMVEKTKGWKLIPLRIMLKHYLDIPWLLKKRGFTRRTCGGAAGIIRLFLSLRDRNIPLWLNTSYQQAIVADGRVIGAVVEQGGKQLRIKANKGVILAAGGFENNQAMREQHLPKPTNTRWSAGCKTNTGDIHLAAEAIDAKMGLMDKAWWCTTKVLPDRPYPHLSIVNKSLPGSIVVNMAGKRFSNESQNYMAFLTELFERHNDEESCVPCYMLFDEDFKRKRSVWPLALPENMIPQSYYDEKFLGKADSIEALADQVGINPTQLQQTVTQFNEYALNGKDPDFNRGDYAYDRYYGDPENQPNPCLGPILKPPFYAVRLNPGDFGTQGGMVINEHGQVLNNQDQVIEGLYACGNCTSAVLPTYPGPGSTLGPAMTFGYIAAKHIAAT